MTFSTRFRHRRSHEVEEGESYYISMTDMMVGVLFIFIIMLSYFALHFSQTTHDLTSAKDAQTAVLLQSAMALERQDVSLEVDRKAHIVCIPGDVLNAGDPDRHCFAYSNSVAAKATPTDRAHQIAAADQAAFMASVGAQMDTQKIPVTASVDNGTLSFTADQLFADGSATLSPGGQAIANQVATTLAAKLPCFGYDAPAANCEGEQKMSLVNVVASLNFNAFTPEGRAQQALALQRSVAFHDALIAAQPVLGQIRNAPNGTPLLQVASYGQSDSTAPVNGSGQTISIQFHMAQ